MKFINTLFIILCLPVVSTAQLISGTVVSNTDEPLIGATILESGTQNGTVTDINGAFSLQLKSADSKIVVSYTGYVADTLNPDFSSTMKITLQESEEALSEVVVTASSTFMERLESKHVEIITESELQKAACCNLSESFETNASVDVSYTDAVSGAKTIRMLGLDGRYVQINRENVPNIRGLIGQYGMGYIPGTWVQSIDVGKGAGSVINGYESMAGAINVELKKPEQSEKLYLNSYVNNFGRVELNANAATKLSERWSGGILLHTDWMGSAIDGNHDGFMDLPKSRQINTMNRYKFQGNRLVSQIGVHVMRDEKAGGQNNFDFGKDSQKTPEYGFSNNTTRAEVFGKTGILFPHQPYKGWGFIYSAAYTGVDAGFGRNLYSGTEKTLYANVIYQNILGNTFHQYKTGASMLLDQFAENYADSAYSRADSAYSRKEIVPGAYFEYSYLPSDQFSLVAANRVDFHNLYGIFHSPRLHARLEIAKKTALRLAVGRGYRVANPVVENTNVLVSSRKLIVTEKLNPEIAWNSGASLTTTIPLGDKSVDLISDYFFTSFENQLIYDMDQNASEVKIYNLKGRSYAHSFQVEAKYQVNAFFGFKTAYKYYDVRSTINGKLQAVPYNSKNRFFLNTTYATKYDKWKADATLQWFGTKRLPDTSSNPEAISLHQQTPDYILVNAQISRGFRWGNIYVGSENLLNFKQSNPIIDPQNPFGSHFDASVVWAPIVGRMIYTGFRYKLK